MAVTLTGDTGLFTRLGRVFGLQLYMTGYFGALVGNQADRVRWWLHLRQVAITVLIEQVNADTELPYKTAQYALYELIKQMEASGADVADNDNNVTLTMSAVTGTGNGVCVLSGTLIMPSYRLTTVTNNDNIRDEIMLFECTQDQQGSGVSGSEMFRVRSEAALPPWDDGWPGGTGIDLRMKATSGYTEQSLTTGQNALVNGNFEQTFVGNLPPNWAIYSGTAGTHIQAVATAQLGSQATKFIGDGATAIGLYQEFKNPATGTPVNLKPNTVYYAGCWFRRASGAITGSLLVTVYDVGGGTLGTVTVNLNTATTTWQRIGVAFTLNPLIGVGPYRVRITTTSLGNTHELYIDNAVSGEMVKLTPSGIYALIHAGGTPFVVQDKFTVTVANPRTEVGVFGMMQFLFDRNFNLHDLSLRLPVDNADAETIVDTLVV